MEFGLRISEIEICPTISKKQRYDNGYGIGYGIGEEQVGISNLLEQGKTDMGGQGGLPYRLLVFPGGFSFFEEGLEAFGGIVRLHQSIEIDLLNRFESLIHVVVKSFKRGFFCQFQNDAA